MKVAVTGASGLVGSRLVPALLAGGHDVIRLVRRPARTADEAAWDPYSGTVDPQALPGIDAVIHLAGATFSGRRWTKSHKRAIRDSRVAGTHTISAAIAELDPPPSVLVSASAIDYYGTTDKPVDESAPVGVGFLPEVVTAWEQAADPARAAGIRVVHPRSGMVISTNDGALQRMLPIFRLGLGGRLGSGRQHWSFVSLHDEIRALLFLLEREDLVGPVNVTSPYPATNTEVTRALAAVVRRPAAFVAPAFALRIAFGELSMQALTSRRVLPTKLTRAGFTFDHPRIEDAVRAAVANRF